MIKSILSLILLAISVLLSFRHGWSSFNYKKNPESVKMMSDLGISESLIPFIGAFMILIAVLLLIPKTFFLGNVLNAMTILLIMALAINSGNHKIALIEIPFLLLPLILIWLKYPFKS